MSAKPSADRSASVPKRGVGIAPLICGLFLVGQTVGDVAAGDLWAVAGFVGGCAAVAVGAGTLLGRGGFDPETDDGESPHATISLTALTALAVGSFAVGVGLYVV